MPQSKPKIFLVAGLTGGPFFPLPWYHQTLTTILEEKNFDNQIKSENLKIQAQVYYIGVKNSFEEKTTKQNNLNLITLPSVKLSILSFKKQKPSELIKNIWSLFVSIIMLGYSVLKSVYLLFKYQPKVIVTTGSFLAVPLVIAREISQFFGLKTKLIVHQQDPLPGLSNRFSIRFADLSSCLFEYTKDNFARFKKSKIIPNPILESRYNKSRSEDLEFLKQTNPELHKWLQVTSQKPILFIFGGGSGSQDINKWVFKNLQEINQKYRVIHLTGLLQNDETREASDDYFTQKAFITEMIPVLKLSNLVMCRAGLGSISELKFLGKKGLLVPLPHSHQELNAKLANEDFLILEQSKMDTWVELILDIKDFSSNNSSKENYLKGLQEYINSLDKVLNDRP
jgi:UDP-N-acetylglucosamine--N-acetylmuramyl-(pentapeptide) pyrophosphoryl-undecaprenol N-acetylglucosamine transferase